MDQIDWTLIPAFLAVADHGSLSAAARAAHISQPTIGRHIKALEDAAGYDLFHRRARGLELTDAGANLLPAARAMADAAHRFSLAATGATETLSGSVRITASVYVAHYLLPPIISSIRTTEPEIQIDLVATDDTDNLLYREADIAIRMYRPTQLDIIATKLGEMPMGLFAHKNYLQRRGTPTSVKDFMTHDIVGYDRDERIIQGMRNLGVEATREMFPARSDAQTVYWELVRAGCGIGVGQQAVGDKDPDLFPVLPGIPIPPLPVWLAAPEALRRSPRIRRVWDLLDASLRPLVS